jgi:Na+-driven multidrug efflux pump
MAPLIRSVVVTAMPLAAFCLLRMAVSLTDMVLYSRLDAHALAVAAVISDAQSIVFGLSGAGLIAIVPLVAAADRHDGSVQDVVGRGVAICAILTLVAAVCVAAAPEVLQLLGVGIPDMEQARVFARVSAAGCAALVVLTFVRSVLSGLGENRIVVTAMIVSVPLNALLSLVFSMWPPPLTGGPAGAIALATAITYGAVAMWLVAALRRRVRRPPGRPAFAGTGALVRTVAFTGAAMFCETGVFLASTLLAATLAPDAFSTHVAAFRLLAIGYCAFVGIGQAAQVIAAKTGRSTAAISVATALVAGAAGFVVATVLLAGFTVPADPASYRFAALLAGTALCLALSTTGLSVLRAAGGEGRAALVACFGYWMVGAGLLGCALAAGVDGLIAIWIALAGSSLFTAAAAWEATRANLARAAKRA